MWELSKWPTTIADFGFSLFYWLTCSNLNPQLNVATFSMLLSSVSLHTLHYYCNKYVTGFQTFALNTWQIVFSAFFFEHLDKVSFTPWFRELLTELGCASHIFGTRGKKKTDIQHTCNMSCWKYAVNHFVSVPVPSRKTLSGAMAYLLQVNYVYSYI